MTDLTPDHPSLEEVRRHWGLAVDIHRRDERLAEFDRLIQAVRAEAFFLGWEGGASYGKDRNSDPQKKGEAR